MAVAASFDMSKSRDSIEVFESVNLERKLAVSWIFFHFLTWHDDVEDLSDKCGTRAKLICHLGGKWFQCYVFDKLRCLNGKNIS